MTPLTILAATLTAATGVSMVAHWHARQSEGAATDYVSRSETLRAEMAVQQTALASEREQLRSLTDQRERLRADIVDSSGDVGTPPNPDSEGLFPEDKPYFYMKKEQLINVVFEPFGWSEMNPVAAVLFGMNDDERREVLNAYTELYENVQKVEAAHFESMDMPVSDAQRERRIIGRLPNLKPQTDPLRQAFHNQIELILGPERASLFLKHVEYYFTTEMDDLGAEAREFELRGSSPSEGGMSVRYPNNGSVDKITYGPGWERNFRFRHLFGPGGPGDVAKLFKSE